MEELVLLFINQVPGIFFEQADTAAGLILKAAITTPLGKLDHISQAQLANLTVPYLSEDGRTGRAPVKKLYLYQVLDNLQIELHIDKNALFDGSRGVVVVAGADFFTGSECIPAYFGTTQNPENMQNLQRLEANVMRCLDEGLDRLPDEVFSKWNSNILPAIFNQARNVISGQIDRTTNS
jgi:hypothetical protein